MKIHFFIRYISLATLLFCLDLAEAQTVKVPGRIISVNYTQVKGPKSTVYRKFVGAGRVAEGLRADWQEQLRACKQEIGFEYLRCHGLLEDGLGVYSTDSKGSPIYNWQYIDMVYDFLLSIHVRPLVEIGFMPQALATIPSPTYPEPKYPSGKARPISVFWWGANITPPKSWDNWDALIKALIQHWTERYGAVEVSKWYFEIWNEPNLNLFFSPNDESMRRDEYFALYAHTARDITSVSDTYRVGGPASAGPVWTRELIDYCTAKKVPLSFISFHAYGLGDGPGGLDVTGHKPLYVSRDLDSVTKIAHSQDTRIRSSSMPNLPVYITEWSASYSGHDPVHDSYFEAPYILEQLKHSETVGAMSYWTFTDIFEEGGPQKTPFEGGFGLINLQGIKKAAFFAYQYMNELGDEELTNTDDKSWVCRDESGGVQALFFDLTDPRGKDSIPDWDLFRQRIVPNSKPPVRLTISSVPSGQYRLTVYRIGFEENDAYSAYLKMNAPSQLTLPQVEELKALASNKPCEEDDIVVNGSGRFEHFFSMRENEVVFATLTPGMTKK